MALGASGFSNLHAGHKPGGEPLSLALCFSLQPLCGDDDLDPSRRPRSEAPLTEFTRLAGSWTTVMAIIPAIF